MMNYLENGNILNSVNYPKCDMGICTQAGRIAIFHRNKANMITKFTACFGDEGVNITDMMNKIERRSGLYDDGLGKSGYR